MFNFLVPEQDPFDNSTWYWRVILDKYSIIVIIIYYYMAMSQKDWKQKNSRIWLAKIDFDRGLDFPI